MSHKTVACTVTLRASFQRKRQFGRTVDLSLPGRTTETVWKELRLALRTGRCFTCPKFGNDVGLEDHTVIAIGFTSGQRTAKDTDRVVCLSETMRARTHTLLTAWKY